MSNSLFVFSLSAIWLILLYHMFLAQGGFLLHLRHWKTIEKWSKTKRPLPKVSILIPAHNEEVVIERTIRAMARLEYPEDKLEVIVINDNSSDSTGEIADRLAQKYSFLKVIHLTPENAGKGKSGALNRGLAHATGDMVVVYDADNTPERKAVYYLVMALQNCRSAGAAVGKFRVINAKKNLLTRFINIETLCFQWMAQAGRCFWFGLTTIPGTNFIIRRSLIEKLGGWDERALAEDTELTIRVYNAGYHIPFIPAAVTWEQEPETWAVWWKQRTRWARGNLYVMLKYLGSFFTLKNKLVVLDLIYFAFTYFLFFISVIISNSLFVGNLFWDLNLRMGAVSLVLWILAYMLYITQVMMSLSNEKSELKLNNLFVAVLMYVSYSQVWLALVANAIFLELKRVILRQEVKWYKTERFVLQSRAKRT